MATPETQAKDGIKRRLKELKKRFPKQIKCWWYPGAAYMEDTVDCMGWVNSYPFAIEVKRYDGKGDTTKRQMVTLRECCDAGAYTQIVDSPEQEDRFIRWLTGRCIS